MTGTALPIITGTQYRHFLASCYRNPKPVVADEELPVIVSVLPTV